jgi:hypothetical protein
MGRALSAAKDDGNLGGVAHSKKGDHCEEDSEVGARIDGALLQLTVKEAYDGTAASLSVRSTHGSAAK